MKKTDKIIKMGLVFIALVCFSLLAKADTFHSTAAGGFWDNPDTWEEAAIPTSYDDIIITGPGAVYAFPWPATACNDLTINSGALLQNYTYAEITLTVYGDITNNGTITNSLYDHFNLKIYGDMVNNGVWENYSTEMVGTNSHQISQGGSGEFTGYRFEAANTTGTIYVMSDFNFNGTHIFLNGITMELDNSKGANLSIIGNYLRNGELKCNGQELYMHNGAYLWDMTIESAILKGIVGVYDYGDTFNGNTIVEDTLQSLHYLCYLTVNDILTNNGVIRNSVYHPLHMNIYGDIINNGEWVNETINMAGGSDQYISLSAGQEFGCSNFVGTDTTTVKALTDLTFNGTQIDFNNGRLIMPIGGGGILTMHGGSLRETDLITNSGTLFMDNGATLRDQSVIHNATLKGIVGIYDNGVVLNGNTIVEDTLQSLHYIGNLTVNDTLTNNGVIRNSIYHHLNIDVYGDIVNNGEWINNSTILCGSNDQHIYLMGDAPIEGNVQFDAVLATTPFQWFHGGVLLDSPDFNGETSQVLSWNVPVQSPWYGTFYCETGEGNSRNIIVGQDLYPASNLQTTVNCTNVELSWEMQSDDGPDSWNVYRDDELIVNVTEMFYTDEMLMPEINYSYYVTAVYNGEESEPTSTVVILVPIPDNIAPVNLSATVEASVVSLSWQSPEKFLEPDGYNIYRDGSQINTSLINETEYTDTPGTGSFEYYVTAVYYFGESEPSSIETIHISGVNELNESRIKVYPNPASDYLYIETELKINTIQIFNSKGQVITEKKVLSNQFSIKVHNYKPGLYFLLLKKDKGFVNMKFTVQ